MEIQEYLQKIKHMRYDYSDEIPEKILNGGMYPLPKYKVRINWFHGLIGWLNLGINYNFFDQRKYSQINRNFAFHIQTTTLCGDRLITRGDINIGNKILDIMIKDLECRILAD